jgi:CheY-like chemotaxis protein
MGLCAVRPGTPAEQFAALSLEEVNARRPPSYAPLHENQNVTVRGVVAAPAFHFPTYAVLAIQDAGRGAVLNLKDEGRELDAYRPGDEIEADGQVILQAGMATISPVQIRRLGRKPVPAAQTVAVEDLMGFAHLGQLVRTEARVIDTGDTTGGSYLWVATRKGNYRLFFPHRNGAPSAVLTAYAVGDRVQVTGVGLQYVTTPPYDRGFELLVEDTSQIIVTGRSWVVAPPLVAATAVVVVLVALVFWVRERRMRSQRERLRRIYQLGEQILGASTIDAIFTEISESLPQILKVSRVHLFVYNRSTKALDAVSAGGQAPTPISLSAPPGGTPAGAVACFHYRTLLAIPDIERSPFPLATTGGDTTPKSLVFVPMLSQAEVVGVLELDQDDRARDFTSDEQALAQHLGNQIGVAVRLLDQRSVQEQLYRTEKLAAIGRLISGVVNELETPLASIEELSGRALAKSRNGLAEREVLAIAAESRKAMAIVSRLVSFAAAQPGEVQPVCITTLLRSLIEFRERDWKASGIRLLDLTTPESLFVVGSQGQLEQAFLTLLVHAEQTMEDAVTKTLSIRSSVLGKRLLVEIGFSAPDEKRALEETAAVLGVTRGVIAGHGGEVRLVEKNHNEPRFEVELPLAQRERAVSPAPPSKPQRESARHATALVIEPDETVQRQLRDLLAARGCRVVPVSNADTGLELAQRMRFDAAFCSVHAPGLNWVELSERLHLRVGAFVLLSDRYDADLAADFEGENRFVLAKPVQEADLERVLQRVESTEGVRNPAG